MGPAFSHGKDQEPDDCCVAGSQTIQVQDVLHALASARLITLGQDSIEVAHEALIREWPRLRGWLDEDRDGLLLARGLTTAAHDWSTLGRDEGALYRGARLADTRAWIQRTQPLRAGWSVAPKFRCADTRTCLVAGACVNNVDPGSGRDLLADRDRQGGLRPAG